MEKASYKKRPAVARALPNTRLNSKGEEIVSSKPHPELLAAFHPPTLQEQVDNLTRLSRIRRTTVMRDLENLDDDTLDLIDDEIDDELGMTPYEYDGLAKAPKFDHEIPGNVSGELPTPSPAGDPPKG